MKAIFVSSILIIFFTLTGCLNSSKTIYIRDSKGEPIKQCMVLAVESNMFFPNKKVYSIPTTKDKHRSLIMDKSCIMPEKNNIKFL